MAKNVIVVDEQGNEYEATYPKRAKGLVKNGRARFVAENKICLACPPNEFLEEQKMSDKLTLNQIYNQITELQKQMESLQGVLFQFQCVQTQQDYVESDDGEITLLDYMPEVSLEKIKAIKEIVLAREENLSELLHFYLMVYRQLSEGNAPENSQQKAE